MNTLATNLTVATNAQSIEGLAKRRDAILKTALNHLANGRIKQAAEARRIAGLLEGQIEHLRTGANNSQKPDGPKGVRAPHTSPRNHEPLTDYAYAAASSNSSPSASSQAPRLGEPGLQLVQVSDIPAQANGRFSNKNPDFRGEQEYLPLSIDLSFSDFTGAFNIRPYVVSAFSKYVPATYGGVRYLQAIQSAIDRGIPVATLIDLAKQGRFSEISKL